MGFSALTNTIQNSLNWAAAYLVQRPTTGVGGTAGEPAITTANLIMGIILGAPFKWEWNRVSNLNAFQTKIGFTDYKVALPTFGYLEKGIVIDPSINTAQTGQKSQFEMSVYKILGQDNNKPSRPMSIAVLVDDNAGNITFRLSPVPDKVYTIGLDYQMAPNFIAPGASLSNTTWAPIPDKLSYIYQRGFLAHLQGMYNAQMYFAHMSMFFRQLVSACEGLTETEKNIFLEEQLRTLQTQQASVLGTQQGKAARVQ